MERQVMIRRIARAPAEQSRKMRSGGRTYESLTCAGAQLSTALEEVDSEVEVRESTRRHRRVRRTRDGASQDNLPYKKRRLERKH